MSRPSQLVLLTLVALIAGCGETSDGAPEACLSGAGFYVEGGRGDVRISDCLTESQSGGELATVGTAMVEVATELNREARAEPGGDANRQLGYLVGAAERGAEGTGGIHADLLRRLKAAALYSPADRSPSATFLSTYRRGVEAGRRQG